MSHAADDDRFSPRPSAHQPFDAVRENNSTETPIGRENGTAGSLAISARRKQLHASSLGLGFLGLITGLFNMVDAPPPMPTIHLVVGLVIAALMLVLFVARAGYRTIAIAALSAFVLGHLAGLVAGDRFSLFGAILNFFTAIGFIALVSETFVLARHRSAAIAFAGDRPICASAGSSLAQPASTAITESIRGPLDLRDVTITAGRSVSPMLIISLGVAIAAIAAGILGQWGWLLAAAPICFTTAVLFSTTLLFPTRYWITRDAFVCTRPRLTLPFAEIVGAVAGERDGAGRFSIFVLHPRHGIRISSRLSCDSKQLLEALCRRIPPYQPPRHMPLEVQSFFDQQSRLHCADQIRVFHAFPRPCTPSVVRPLLKLTLACLLAIPIWIAMHIGIGENDPRTWIVVVAPFLAFVAAMVSGGYAWYIHSACRPLERRLKGACVAMSPDGLAIRQGDVAGEMHWKELTNLRVRLSGPTFTSLSDEPPGITLKLGDTKIRMEDIYDAPLDEMAELIESYCGGSLSPRYSGGRGPG